MIFARSQAMRIISLGPYLTEDIYLLGEEDKLVGCTAYCMPKTEKERVATIIDVNLEKTVSLKPDLVLATALTNVKDIAKLKSLGVDVEVFAQAKNFNELCFQFLRLAGFLDKKSFAEELIQETKKKVSKIE
jgi:iron complex transport system substrate-binding protein